MEDFITALDEYFCAQYADYVRLSAIEGYEMPEVVYVDKGGNIARRDSSCMRLIYQKNKDELLKKFKLALCDTDYAFNFSFIPLGERLRMPFKKYTFAKLLPDCLRRAGETVESAGEKLDIGKKFWRKIVKGKLYPSKNTVLALALTCRLQAQDTSNLLAVLGFTFEEDSVRDTVVHFLMAQSIYNENMRDKCLAEYRIENLPIRRSAKA